MTGTFSFNFLYECEQFTGTVLNSKLIQLILAEVTLSLIPFIRPSVCSSVRPSVRPFNVFSEVEGKVAEEIIEEIEEDVYDDDSEVEPEDGESHEEAKLKTQEKDLVTLK